MPTPPKVNRDTRSRKAQTKRRQNVNVPVRRQLFLPPAYDYNDDLVEKYEAKVAIGTMSKQCTHCGAKTWNLESVGLCCNNGKVKLDPLPEPPALLLSLLHGDHPKSTQFLKYIRRYNYAFAMTSLGCKEETFPSGFKPTFKICGRVYHRHRSYVALPGEKPQFMQLYFLEDLELQLDLRSELEQICDRELLAELQIMLHQNNHFVREFKTLYEKIIKDHLQIDQANIVIKDSRLPNVHPGRTNLPTVPEIAILMSGDYANDRDIVLEGTNGQIKYINSLHRSYDPLQYPLLFPHGTDGYFIDLKSKNGGSIVSQMQYYKYLLMTREDNYLLGTKDLLNVFLVDVYAKIESERMQYIRNHQKELRSEQYSTLCDALASDVSASSVGKLVVLPSSFTGSPRYMNEKMQDGMCYIRKYGTADYFITFTCNPKWSEIGEVLTSSEKSHHRNDLIARVFHLKVKNMMKLIKQQHLFGTMKAFMYSIEWQKRGLPHAHIILWVEERLTADKIDRVICAEIPSQQENLTLHNLVKKHMIHGPCGVLNRMSVCMVENKCSRHYPRAFTHETRTKDDGYPLYRRRPPSAGGHSVFLTSRMPDVDNSWVVPYNPLLLHIFDAHINVEACHSVKSVKYICKYIVKGGDQATVKVDVHDECETFISGRYVSSAEAAWRIFGFYIHEHHPTIQHLAVHLENGQRVYFDTRTVHDRLESVSATTLTEFFELCKRDNLAKTLYYEDVPKYFKWEKKSWTKRKRGKDVPGYPTYYRVEVIGRVYTIHPTQRECYFLRLLLFHVRGPDSFKALRTVDGVEKVSYQAACEARGLLENDLQWINALIDASMTLTGYQMRHLFALILVYCEPSDSNRLYTEFKEALAHDLLHKHRKHSDQDLEYTEAVFQEALGLIDEIVQSFGLGLTVESFSLPINRTQPVRLSDSIEYLREVAYNVDELKRTIEENEHRLNAEQNYVYTVVCNAVLQKEGTLFFLDAPGGTGKTFVMNTLLARLRREKKVAIAVASSGIAATLLQGGRTVHSTFKVPLNITEISVCEVSHQSGLAKLIRMCDFVLWDECSMSHRYVLEAVDRTFRDIRSTEKPMGGVTVLFGGDFRQTLPVVKRGTRADVVQASLKYSVLWHHVTLLPPLIHNVRLIDDNVQFADILLQLGNGTFPQEDDVIDYSSFANVTTTLEELMEVVWPNVADIVAKSDIWIAERTILAPLNTSVNSINTFLLQQVTSEKRTYYSLNSVVNEEDTLNFPVEFLNSIELPGLPLHQLTLAVGIPIMLIRNLKPPFLCNGTRLRVLELTDSIIRASILTGPGVGETVGLPRIPVKNTDYPFEFKRTQFPIKVCFAITINKAQGQSFNYVGINLIESCFSHGQFYVACSRATSALHLHIYSPRAKTENIVYTEIL